MAYFTDFLNQMFTPSEGREWKYEMAPEPERYSDEWYDSSPGGTPTYYIAPSSRGETLTSAPPSVYNRPAQGDVVPQPQAMVDVGEPNPLYALAPLAAAVPAAEAMRRQRGRNQAATDRRAQQARVSAAKQQRAASQLRGAASPAASAADYAEGRYGSRVTRGGMPVPSGASPVLEGEYIPRNASPARVTPRPGLPRPPIEGTVVRRGPGMMTKGGTALSLVGLPLLASAYEAEGASPEQAYGTALAETLLGLAVGPSDYLGGGMDVPAYGDTYAPGFSMRPMLSDLINPQSFDTVNDILINQYLEGISPWADVTYYR